MKNILSAEEELTLQSYNLNATEWDATHTEDYKYWTEERKQFHKLLPKGKILEIGSGGGHDARILHSLGYDYVGIDPSEKFLEIAKFNNPGLTFLHCSIYDMDFADAHFDGFWAAEVLLHIPKARIDNALQNIHRVLTSGGIGFISIKQGDGERIIKEDRKEHGNYSRLFSFYSQVEFTHILKRNSFSIIHTNIQPPDGDTTWITYIVQKNSTNHT